MYDVTLLVVVSHFLLVNEQGSGDPASEMTRLKKAESAFGGLKYSAYLERSFIRIGDVI